jgi:hypothetical protein
MKTNSKPSKNLELIELSKSKLELLNLSELYIKNNRLISQEDLE